jgi:hypothetical protein
MLIKRRDITVETINEARQAESGPTVLTLLKTPLESYSHEQKLEGYRQRIAESKLALTIQRNRLDDLLRQLAEEEAKDQIDLPLT